jgi:hypothetical protein
MPRRNLVLNPCVDCGTAKSDMICPLVAPLDGLIDELSGQGFEAHFNEIDAQTARSLLAQCTNCGARGRFTYTGMKIDVFYRAFWSCRSCAHWIEV